jgi:hypothetical protein
VVEHNTRQAIDPGRGQKAPRPLAGPMTISWMPRSPPAHFPQMMMIVRSLSQGG